MWVRKDLATRRSFSGSLTDAGLLLREVQCGLGLGGLLGQQKAEGGGG